jgi:hypothetical protein
MVAVLVVPAQAPLPMLMVAAAAAAGHLETGLMLETGLVLMVVVAVARLTEVIRVAMAHLQTVVLVGLLRAVLGVLGLHPQLTLLRVQTVVAAAAVTMVAL